MLTTVQIRAIKPEARPFKVPDTDGLFLLVQPSGALLWRFRYKMFGTERKLSLGSFPKVSLKDARLARDKARAEIVDGCDPVAEKRQRQAEAELAARTTFTLIAEEYIEKMEREGRSPKTIKKARWFLDLLRPLGKQPIASITPHELLAALKRIERRSHHETALRLRAFAGRVFRYGFATLRSATGPEAVEFHIGSGLTAMRPNFGGSPHSLTSLKVALCSFPNATVRSDDVWTFAIPRLNDAFGIARRPQQTADAAFKVSRQVRVI